MANSDVQPDSGAQQPKPGEQPQGGPGVDQVEDPIVPSDDTGDAQADEGKREGEPEAEGEMTQDDPSAPYGRDAAGVALAPYGYKTDGVTPARKRGRKPASVTDEREKQRARLRSVTQAPPRPQKAPAIETPALAVVNYQAMGETVAGLFFNVGIMALGDEWAPDTKEGEHLAVAAAFRDYFKANQYKDLPPGFALALVLGAYSLKRATRPTIKSKLASFAAWAKSKIPFRR